MSSLLNKLQHLAQTGDPYYQQAIKNAAKVRIHTVRRDSLMTMLLKGGMPGFEPESGKCYDNALRIALALERSGVYYVEGFVRFGEQIYSHAWISHEGRYFDPTYEVISIKNGYSPSLVKEGEYVKIAEMTASHVWANCLPGGRTTEYLPPTPVTVSMWGYGDLERDCYAPIGHHMATLSNMLIKLNEYKTAIRAKAI